MQNMIKSFTLWVRRNKALSNDTINVSSRTIKAMEFLNSLLPEEHSLDDNKLMYVTKRKRKS